MRKFRQQSREQMEERRPNLVAALNKIDDFYMELKWDFQSWGELLKIARHVHVTQAIPFQFRSCHAYCRLIFVRFTRAALISD